MKRFTIRYQYFKPESGKWYTEHTVSAGRNSISELSEEVIEELQFEPTWPGLSTRGNFDVVVEINNLDETESITFLRKWREE